MTIESPFSSSFSESKIKVGRHTSRMAVRKSLEGSGDILTNSVNALIKEILIFFVEESFFNLWIHVQNILIHSSLVVNFN